MIDSTPAKVAFTFAVLQKFGETGRRYVRAGRVWRVPPSLIPALKRFRAMARRYDKAIAARQPGQKPCLRHDAAEAAAEADIALWVLNQHKALLGLPPVQSLPCNMDWVH